MKNVYDLFNYTAANQPGTSLPADLAQANRIARVANDTMREEMERRAAMSMEERRLSHHFEMKRMEEETERQKAAMQHDALLKRLDAESGIARIIHG